MGMLAPVLALQGVSDGDDAAAKSGVGFAARQDPMR